MINFINEAEGLFEYTQGLRRDFHKHPELGFKEIRTASVVVAELKKMGLDPISEIGTTGVVCLIEGENPGPVVLCRVDMDALPMTEETGAEYSSQNEGVMHACGHDAHVAMGLTIAKILVKHQDKFCGSVKMVFQPAEEGLGGAERMIEDGVLENPIPDYSLSIHVWNIMDVGTFGITKGPAMAASNTLKITITGKGAHGAQPHMSKDPVLAAAHIITALQSIVARNIDPMETAVLSITSIHGGTAFNIIPPDVVIQGTVRSFLPEVKTLIVKRLDEIVKGIGRSMDCEVEIEVKDITPPVINDVELAKRVQEIAKELFPGDKIVDDSQTMGSEDMAFMMEDIPGCYVFLGSKNDEKGFNFGHHHPKFDIDETALPKGVALMTATIFNLLNE